MSFLVDLRRTRERRSVTSRNFAVARPLARKISRCAQTFRPAHNCYLRL